MEGESLMIFYCLCVHKYKQERRQMLMERSLRWLATYLIRNKDRT